MNKNNKNKTMKTKGYRKLLIPLALVLIMTPLTAMAQTFNFDNSVNEVFQFFSLILTALQAVLWPILLLMGGLLSNDLLFSGGMNTMLLGIWSAIRDLVNILFVIGLLFVAIYNIIGLAGENYSITKVLPKIALALIAVNFSFLMAKVVLDAVNVTTTAIFAMPLAQDALGTQKDATRMDQISQAFCNSIMNLEGADKNQPNPYCKEKAATETAPAAGAQAGSTATPTEPAPTGVKKVKGELTDLGKQFFSSFNGRNVAIVMAVMLMDITKLDEVKATGTDGKILAELKTIKDLSINTIFSLVFFIIYATAFVALFVTLLVRIVVLWVTIAIMPLSFLGIAFDKAKLSENDPLKMFLDHAIVPVKVALALTIGMIMINQLKQIAPGPAYSTAPATLGALTSNMSTLQDIMAGLATAVVIWMAAFWAMKGTKASPFVDKIQSTVKGWGTDIAKLPLYAPILPVGKGGEKVGLAALGSAAGGGPLRNFYQQENERIARIFGDKNKEAETKLKGVKTEKDAKTAIPEVLLMTNYSPNKETQTEIARLLHDNPFAKLKTPGFANKAAFEEALKAGKVTKEQMETFYKANIEPGGALVPPDLNTESTKKAAETAKNAAHRDNTVPSTGLKEAETKLDEALTELKNAETSKDAPKISAAKKKVEDLTKQLEGLTNAKTDLTNFTVSTAVDKDNKIKDQGQAQALKDKYEAANQAFKAADKPEEARKILIDKIKKDLGITNDTTAGQIADTIINYQKPPAAPPAAPAANPPGAPVQPAAQPGAAAPAAPVPPVTPTGGAPTPGAPPPPPTPPVTPPVTPPGTP